ncbi:hypothetical protein PS645_00484 [Pseudomonas fluorescens]|uniref:DUF2388 domain-containing protein n=2 Tax=Pseudomonas fluorescens TaxID=294 RepID=A0A5E6PRJ5_PSEFL|nr:hypothetical protein PS645_00484 [Pseudomonas fluorescens]
MQLAKLIICVVWNYRPAESILSYVIHPLRFMLSEDTVMRRLLLISSLVLCLPVSSAMADVDAKDVATSAGVSASLYSTFKDDKMMIPARDDASSFVASGGTIRGVYLESVMQDIRQKNPGLTASDEELAQAILAQ